MSPAFANPISLTRTLRQEFTRDQLRLAQREIKSFLKFQVTSDEIIRMVHHYLTVNSISHS